MRHYSPLSYGLGARRSAALLLVLACLPAALPAQDTPPAPPSGRIQIQNVTAYFDYYSSALPSVIVQPALSLRSDAAGGGSVQVGWAKLVERTTAAVSYTSSLTGHVRYSEWNAWNHAFSASVSRHLTPRWTLNAAGDAKVTSLDEAVFLPSTLGKVAAVPATFDDLASAMLASRFSNPQLATAMNSETAIASPLGNVLYGQRMFGAGGGGTLLYAASPRLTVSFQGTAQRDQRIDDSNGAVKNSYLISDTTVASGGFTASYSLSPHTQLGGTVSASRTASTFHDSYTVASIATLGHTFARRWVVQVYGGVGIIHAVNQAYSISETQHPVGGASVAFKTLSHTFLATIDRKVGDTYGLAASYTTYGGLTWRWKRPARSWWLESSFTSQRLHQTAGEGISGWRTSAGVGRILSQHVALLAEYVYQRYSNVWQYVTDTLGQNAVRVSVSWSPHTEFR